ncbi:MAG: thermostable hemolysin [Mariprofundaceae bacterium]|nr:thermostable hemolysin [Mariprofundaceae bacterium]
MKIELIGIGHDERQHVEHFIHERFGIEYSADIRHFMPYLLRLGTNEGELIAAAGYRPAGEGKLFVETYLDEPVEDVLSRQCGRSIARDRIVEVGNLADAYPGAGRAAITALTAYLSGMGYEWAVFTGVKKLRNGFNRLGIETEQIGEADTSRLDSEELRTWGRYYQSGPMLVAGNLMKGFWALRFAREVLQPLWRTGLREGKQNARERRGPLPGKDD